MPQSIDVGKAILFYCEASQSVGFGHLSRCLSLADAARGYGFDPVFLVDSKDNRALELVHSRGHQFGGIHSTPEEIVGLIEELRAGWVVVDSYAADESALARVADSARLAVIDDEGLRQLAPASLVVCPVAGSESWEFRVSSTTRVLAGSKYALVADTFAGRRAASLERRVFPKQVRNVAVSLGATDSGGWLSHVIDGLCSWDGIEIRVAGHVTISPMPCVRHVGFLDSVGMADLMNWADLFVSSASTLTWELATLGVPSAFVVTAMNQTEIGNYLFGVLGLRVATSPMEIAQMLSPSHWNRKVRSSASRRLGAICDGLGALRVVDEMNSSSRPL